MTQSAMTIATTRVADRCFVASDIPSISFQPVNMMSEKKASNQMWGGRFASGPSAVMEAINASIGFDKKLYAQDIRGSLAHAEMLAEAGILSAEDNRKIAHGLNTILS